MQIKEIADLIQIIEESSVEEFELERSGVRIRIVKGARPISKPAAADVRSESAAEETVSAEPATEVPVKDESNLQVFKAPIVGTFYEAPKPDADPFVRIGDMVGKGSVVCIIEAMKIFNQIESDFEGEIVRILVENGQPVEFGEPLFEYRSLS